ncbi:MAG: hypothetical protein V1722_02895 [Candidatus Micrarchaeota archaeon]
METTRKIEVEDVLVLKELQKHLLQLGVKTSQKTLLTDILEFISRKEMDFLNYVKKKEQTEDSLDILLRTTYTGKERTNAALEHDLII